MSCPAFALPAGEPGQIMSSLLVVLVAMSVNSIVAELPQNQERLSVLTASALAF